LAATNGHIVLAIECKKTEKEVMTFLLPNENAAPVTRLRSVYLQQIDDSTRRTEVFCADWWLLPPSDEATYCVVSTSAK
jgi:hypothetical protein